VFNARQARPAPGRSSLRLIGWIFVSTLLLPVSPAFGCGESLFRVGKGVLYREYTAPLPGRILIVADEEAELAFVDVLRRAGHQLTVVRAADDVGGALAVEQFDIVMAHYADHAVVSRQIQQSGARVAELPVASAGELDAARAVNPYAPNVDDNIKRFLKAIHRTLVQPTA
jgi:hypothetical protein